MTDNKNDSGERMGQPVKQLIHTNSEARQRLLRLIIEQGILHDSEERPVIARDGKTRLSWVMNFLAISLHADSLRLAARETLKLLESFDGRQLATIGTAAVPLLSACILESNGKYNGLMVRAKRKEYGTASLIDGRINYSESVVVIDDSIGSGTNMLDCIEKLERSGLHVEGCVCLVRFGYDSGYGKLIDRGYRVAALFDIHRDISPHHPNDWQASGYPIKDSFKNIVWDKQVLPDYISPFAAIRRNMAHYWRTGKLLQPPKTFNQPLDTRGGVWLSLRAQDGVYTSQGRHGFWHFPGETDETIDAGKDICRVAWLFACHLQNDAHREQRLAQSAFGLSLFGALEHCEAGEFDQHQHALVIRSEEASWRMGGALPNMPGISGDAHLLHHARFHNTRLYTHEPYQLYRHTVDKLVEPGAEWPTGGESVCELAWDEHQGLIQPITRQLLSWVETWHQDRVWPESVEDLYIPVECEWLFLSVYISGKQVACAGTTPQKASDLLHLVQTTAQDARWQAMGDATGDDQLYIRASFLSQSRYLGCSAQLQSFTNFVMGQEAIAIQQDQQFAIMLPEVPLQQQWTVELLNNALYQKAGITQQKGNIHWRSYRTCTWHVDSEAGHLVSFEKPLPPAVHLTTDCMHKACTDFLSHHRQQNGIINSAYNPDLHQVSQQDALFNTGYVLWLCDFTASGIAGWDSCYQYLIQQLQNGEVTHLERSYAILALLKQDGNRNAVQSLLARQLEVLQGAFGAQGQLTPPESEPEKIHYGVELRALLAANQQGFLVDEDLLQKALLRLLRYTQYQATHRQYPSLLAILAFALNTGGKKGLYEELKQVVDMLVEDLLRWQQSSGAFLPEGPELSPVIFTVQTIDALLDAGTDTVTAVREAVNYLSAQCILPEHKACFPVGNYAVGGMYTGLPDGCLRIPATALFLKVLNRLAARGESV